MQQANYNRNATDGLNSAKNEAHKTCTPKDEQREKESERDRYNK